MAKYDPLFEHLCKADDGPLEMTFAAVGDLVGGLPKSAYSYQAWWANGADGRHVEAHAWMNAGRVVEHVDLNAQIVRFRSARWTRGS